MSGMKFSMEAEALGQTTKQGEENHADMSTLVKRLIDAAEPISKSFNGPAKAAFNNLKANADAVSAQLTNSLAGLHTATNQQDVAFTRASNDALDTHSSTYAKNDFEQAVAKNV